MKLSAILTMIVVLGIVWGGFLTALVIAARAERRRQHDPVDGMLHDRPPDT